MAVNSCANSVILILFAFSENSRKIQNCLRSPGTAGTTFLDVWVFLQNLLTICKISTLAGVSTDISEKKPKPTYMYICRFCAFFKKLRRQTRWGLDACLPGDGHLFSPIFKDFFKKCRASSKRKNKDKVILKSSFLKANWRELFE